MKGELLLLSQKNIDTNIQNIFGETALHIGSRFDSIKCCELLLKHGNIELNIQNIFGETALDYACENDSIQCSSLLSKHPKINKNIENDKKVVEQIN